MGALGFIGLLLILVLMPSTHHVGQGFRFMMIGVRQLAQFIWECVSLPWHCGAWVVQRIRCWRLLVILAASVVASGSPRADTPKVEARRCSAILDLLAQNRVVDALEITNIDAAPDAESHEVQTRYLQAKFAEVFKRGGALVSREKMPDLAVDGSPALIVMERWTYAGGLSNYFGCVRYDTDDEVTTGISVGDDTKSITAQLSKPERGRL